MAVRFGWMLMLAALFASASSAAEVAGVTVGDVKLNGRIDDQSFSFGLDFGAVSTQPNAVLQLVTGDVVLEDLTEPKAGARATYDADKRAYALTFQAAGTHKIAALFAARAASVESGAWREVALHLPAARMRSIEIACDRSDMEVQLPGALKIERSVADGKLVIKALLAPGVPLTVRWKPQVQQLDAKLVFSTEANTIATVTAGAMKVDTLFEFIVSQGKLTELAFTVPAGLSVTQVRGAFIRDWQIKAATEAGKPATLTVALNRPVTERYGLQIMGETVLAAFPTQAALPVVEPVGGIRAGGSVLVGTNSAIGLVVKQTSGLSQINAAAFPRVLLNKDEARALPGITGGKAFAFTHATTPYQMTIALSDIVPTFETTQVITALISEEDLTIQGQIDLEVRDAPLRDIVIDVPAGFVVADVAGQMVDEFVPRPVQANQTSRAVDVRFKQPVLGRTVLGFKLELGKSPLGAAQSLQGFAVRGAAIRRSFIVVAADQGVAVDSPQATNLTGMNTASVPVRVPGAQYAYSFREAGWLLQFTASKKPATIRVESFHLLTLGERVAYGNIAFNYAISGSPVDEFTFRIPPNLDYVDIIGRDVRSVSIDPADPQVRKVKIARKVIGDYTLGMTFSLKYKDGDVIEVGGIQCEGPQVQTQTGYIAIASNLNLEVEPQANPVSATGSDVRVIERDELPGNYQLLVNAPILRAFTFNRTPHTQKLKVSAYERIALLPVVIEVTDIRTDIFAHEDSPTESRTVVRYRIKNSSRQFLPLSMPADVKVWQTRVGTTRIENGEIVEGLQRVTASMDPANNLLMIPLPRHANPNEPITVEVEYGAGHDKFGSFGGNVALAGPTTDKNNAVSSTFTNWTVVGPAQWAVRVEDSNLRPQPREQRHGGLGVVMSRTAGAWGWAWEQWSLAMSGDSELRGEGWLAVATIVLGLAALAAIIYCAVKRRRALRLLVTLSVLLVLTTAGLLAAHAPQVSESEMRPDDLSVLTMTQTVTMNSTEPVRLVASVVPQWRQYSTTLGGIVVPVLAVLVLIVMAFPPTRLRPRLTALPRVLITILALVALLYGLAQYLAFVPAILHLFTWLLPLGLLGFFLWRVLGRPALGMPDFGAAPVAATIALLVMLAAAAQPAHGQATASVISIAPKPPVLDKVTAALKADGDHVEVDLALRITAEEPTRIVLMDQSPIVLTPDDPSAAVRIEAQGRKYYLVVTKPGTHDATFKFLSPLHKAGDDGTSSITFPLPLALTNRVTLTIPAIGLDVHVDQAMRMTKSEANGATIVSAILGPGDDIAASWKPRARATSQEKTSFYSQVISAARLDASLIEARHLVKFQIAQGELRDIRLRIPEPMTVTAVQGKALGAWRFDPAKQELEVRLSEPATGEYAIALITQISREKLPYEAVIAPIIVEDAVRHTGILGLLVSPTVQATVSKGPQAMNVDDFAREADALLRTFAGYAPAPGAPAPGAAASAASVQPIRFAYRTTKADDTVTVQAIEVKPELRAHEDATFAITDDRLIYNGALAIDVSKAGVFNVELKLPKAYEIETLTAPQVSHWDETIEGDIRTVLVHFKEKLIGQAPLKLEMSQQVVGLPKQVTAPRIGVTGVIKHTGQIIIAADRGVRMLIAQREGVSELNPLELGIREQGTLAFKLLKPDWTLTLSTDVVEARVTADFLHVAKVTEGLVRHTYYLSFSLANAGSKVFEFQLPKGVEGVVVTGPDIARREPDKDGSGRYRVELNRKWYDRPYPLTVSYDTKYKLPVEAENAAGTIVIDPLKALNVDQQRGHIAVLSMPRVQLIEQNRSPSLQRAEPRAIPGTFGVRNKEEIAGAPFCYATATSDYSLTLTAQRHQAADLLQADVRKVEIDTIVADTGNSVTKVMMQLRVGDKQHLETILPRGSQVWTLLVAGRSTAPSQVKRGSVDVLLIPLGAAAGRGVYVSPAPDEWSRRHPVLQGPRFDLPLKNVSWQLLLPEHFDYEKFEGTMTVNKKLVDSATFARYGLNEYDAQVYNFNRLNSERARTAQVRGEQRLREGNQKQAQHEFEAAVHYSAFSEDARVKLHQFNSDKALVGLVGSRQRLREQAEGMGAAPAVIADLNTETIDRVKGSLSKADSENLADLTRVWTEVQEKAAGETVQLAINLPYRGRVLEFGRAVQVEPNTPMQVEFTAKPLPEAGKSEARWWVLGLVLGFLALYAMVATLSRRWTSLPDALREDDDDADEVEDVASDDVPRL